MYIGLYTIQTLDNANNSQAHGLNLRRGTVGCNGTVSICLSVPSMDSSSDLLLLCRSSGSGNKHRSIDAYMFSSFVGREPAMELR